VLNRYRELFHALKLKKKFISWMWKSREKLIQALCNPTHLKQFTDDVPFEVFDEFLNNFGVYKSGTGNREL
jgi:hypothetical protein